MKRTILVTMLALLCFSCTTEAQSLPRLQVSANGHYLQTVDGKPFFYISNPALGLWADKAKF